MQMLWNCERSCFMKEIKLVSETKFKGKIATLKVETVQLANQKITQREVVEAADSVGVIALTSKKEIILVKQYRQALEQTIYEIPAGRVDNLEESKVAIQRELLEETGYFARELKLLHETYSSPGLMRSVFSLFLAEDVEQQGSQNLDEDEFVEIAIMNLEDFRKLVESGKIKDMKTLLAYYYLKDYA